MADKMAHTLHVSGIVVVRDPLNLPVPVYDDPGLATPQTLLSSQSRDQYINHLGIAQKTDKRENLYLNNLG